jgi:FK506-binding protein 1
MITDNNASKTNLSVVIDDLDYVAVAKMGVERTVLKPGNGGRKPQKGEMVVAHYVGRFPGEDSKEFDNSRARQKPLTFIIGIGSVIKGWDVGMMQMELGETALLKITSDYGYGEDGLAPMVPPNADLEFEVEILEVGGEKAASSSQCVSM